MLCYKDMTFCPGPCATIDCERHERRVYEAAEYFKENPYVGIAWFVELPKDCKQYKPVDNN